MTEDRRLLTVLKGERLDPPPLWMMRQAGRYLPEYRKVRATAPDFISFCLNPEKAAEVTLQPIRRFDFDASIVFADILLIPMTLGRRVWFEPGEGPKLDPLDIDTVDKMKVGDVEGQLGPVGETLSRVRAELPNETTLIGFAGAPWTVATYMMEGGGSKDRLNARAAAWRDPERFDVLLGHLVDATARYLVMQAKSGADVLKLFDSWADSLPEPLFERVIIAPTRAIIDKVRAAGITTPIIGFPKGAGTLYARYAAETGIDAIALDHGVDPVWAHSALPQGMPVQGQLDPSVLLAGGPALDNEIARIMSAWKARPHIFNLGHGISPGVPIAHVERLIEQVRKN